MFKEIFVLCAFVAISYALPAGETVQAAIQPETQDVEFVNLDTDLEGAETAHHGYGGYGRGFGGYGGYGRGFGGYGGYGRGFGGYGGYGRGFGGYGGYGRGFYG
ncbi:uncharacterized protein LOC134831379 [Culicoides brevitarsis]|uniref:uncharacterized protein LOC134831379 n=1 Tax=Culicoides brevitarsis TaxID=469753 RepID=UPI00307C4DD2